MKQINGQIFNIDLEQLYTAQDAVGATSAQMSAAYNRAVARTAVTIKKLAAKEVAGSLNLKSMKLVQKRLQQFRLRSKSKNMMDEELKLWFGLNDVSVGFMKGSIKKTSRGAKFTPTGSISSHYYDGGFVMDRYKRRSIFLREGSKVKEARVPVSNELQETIEDDVFSELPDIFMHHFNVDLKSRVKLGKNMRNWRE